MPSTHGVHDWIEAQHPDSEADHFIDEIETTPQVLAAAGYQCGMAGKWHVGDSRQPAPGFEFWYAHRYGGGPYTQAPIWCDGEPVNEPRYLTHAITEEGLTFLQTRDKGRPFYLQLNYTAPHTPWVGEHPEEYLRHYTGCEFPSVPRHPRHPWSLPRHDFDGAFANPEPGLAGYCAALTAVDDGLGQLRAELEAQEIWDDTVLVYLSDNGFSCGHHGMWGKGNGTYPLNFWDNSVRVPFFIRVPDGARGVSAVLLSSAALHPTLCDLAGVSVDDRLAAASSFAPLLRGEPFAGEQVVVAHSEYGGGRMITDGRWKLVLRWAGPTELYDLATDPDELDNLADDPRHSTRQQELGEALEKWFSDRERPGFSAYHRNVRGYGQIRPVTKGHSDERTYLSRPYGYA